jgi:hypothetical protein
LAACWPGCAQLSRSHLPRRSSGDSPIKLRKFLSVAWLLLVVLSVGSRSPAQDAQRFEVFGGYSLTQNSGLGWLDLNNNFSGWNGSSTIFLNRWFGVTADFSGHYGSRITPSFLDIGGQPLGEVKNTGSFNTFLFGPHFTYRRSRYAPFVESLFGLHKVEEGWTILQDECAPTTCPGDGVGTRGHGLYHKFGMAIGGGLDIALSHGISLRPVEVDYLLLRQPRLALNNGGIVFYDGNNNSFRYSTGITFRFGPHFSPPR